MIAEKTDSQNTDRINPTAPKATKKGSKQAEKPVAAPVVEQPAATPIEPQEAPQSAETAPAPAEDKLGDYLRAEIDAQHEKDNRDRNNPELRMEMCRLIDELNRVLEDHAAVLAHLDDDPGAFHMDAVKDLMTWQLGEFITRSIIDRDPNEPPILRGWQVDAAHARDFFAVDVLSDHSLVALEVEEGRK